MRYCLGVSPGFSSRGLPRPRLYAPPPVPLLAKSKLVWLLSLYFAQGLPFGFQSTALPVYLRAQGASVTSIGFLGLLAAPWALKALWAPFVDRHFSPRLGRRKSWIVPLHAALVVTTLAAALIPVPERLGLLLAAIFALNLLAATQDIAVDGLAVDCLTPRELGWGNAAQVVGYKLGMLTGGGLLLWATPQLGWQGLFVGMAAAHAAALWLTLWSTEPPATPRSGSRLDWAELFRTLRAALQARGSLRFLAFILTYKVGESMSDVLYKPFLVDAGVRPEQLGEWLGTWGGLASIAGSLGAGLLVQRFSPWAALAVCSALRLIPLLGRYMLAESWSVAHELSVRAVAIVTIGEELFGGALTTAMFALMMSRVDRRIGATHFTLLASLEVLGKAPAGPLGGVLVGTGALSYAGVFLLGALLSALFLVCLPLVRASDTIAREDERLADQS